VNIFLENNNKNNYKKNKNIKETKTIKATKATDYPISFRFYGKIL
jgi:hypothetical protein